MKHEAMLQVLKQPLADVVTLDFKRISGKGIISGASFKVPTLQQTHICFGSTPTDQVNVQGSVVTSYCCRSLCLTDHVVYIYLYSTQSNTEQSFPTS